MKKNEPNKDRGLRLVLQHRNEASERMALTEDFTDRLMQRIGEQVPHAKSKRHRPWLYTFVGAVAASILLLLAFHYTHDHVNPGKGTVIAQQTEQQKHPSKPEPQRVDEQRQSQQREQQDNPVKAHEGELTPMIAQKTSGEKKKNVVSQQPQTTSAVHQTSAVIPTTDSLDYYIDKIERELAQVDESLYIERMNKVIRADERLQRLVNSYILHTLDKDGRPQTADNMYNEKTEQDDE